MKSFFFAVALLCGGALVVSAQERLATIVLSPRDTINNVIPVDMQYALPNFTTGDVIYKNGKGAGDLNYSYYSQEMQFINPGTDQKMKLANVQDVKEVLIAGKRFLPFKDGTFGEVLREEGQVSLVLKQYIKTPKGEKPNAYSSKDQNAVENINKHVTIRSANVSPELNGIQYYEVRRYTDYFLLKDGKYTEVKNLKSFLKAFPLNKADEIEKFANENLINFNKKEDIIRILDFSNKLNI